MDRQTEVRIQNTEAGLTAETQRRREINVGAGLVPTRSMATAWVAPIIDNLRGAQPNLRHCPSLLIMICLASFLFIIACDKKTEGITNPTTTTNSSISFSSSGIGGNNTVYMAYNNVSNNILAIDVKAGSLSSGVYGAAFDVDFDSSKMIFDSYVAGSFLENGGNTVSYQVGLQSGNSGKLIVGISRQGNVSGVTGSGTIVTLKFKVTSAGSLAFSNSAIMDPSNQVISGISWSGGTVTVQ